MRPTSSSESADLDVSASARPSNGPRETKSAGPSAAFRARRDAGEVDEQLIQQTRQQIRTIVQEIGQLAQADLTADEFHEAFLSRVTSALASVGAACWMKNADDQIELQYAVNLPEALQKTDDREGLRHHLLVQRQIQTGEAVLVPPRTRGEDPDEPGNPTPYLLVIAPIEINQETVGLIEVFQRPDSGPTTQRGYLRFLMQMTEVAGDYHKSRKLRAFEEYQTLWSRLEQFIRAIHRSLDPRDVTFAIVNEGRTVLGCDRVSLAVARGKRCSIEAVSGLDSIDRRADELRCLAQLTNAVTRTGEPLWYRGEDEDLPPQLENKLHHYLDRSHSKCLGIVPFHAPAKEPVDDPDEGAPEGTLLGALIVEQIGESPTGNGLANRTSLLADHSADALSNVREHNRIPLIPLWRRMGQALELTGLNSLPFAATVAIILSSIAAFLCLMPWQFQLASEGSLMPVQRYEVFAPMDGLLKELYLPADANTPVGADQPLALIENNTLESEISGLEGSEKSLITRWESLQRALIEENSQLSAIDEIQLQTDVAEIEESLYTVRQQLTIKRQQLASLQIVSPADGTIANWRAQSRLLRRPVQKGQSLLTVIAPEGDWELELELDEKRVGHLMRAAAASDEPLAVTFVLVSDPSREFRGTIARIHQVAEVRESGANVVLIQVTFDKRQIPAELLRYGTRVRARIDCGERTAGFVLFHDVIETIQSRVLFWL